jgi:C4-dicarboxylate-specific signal transduction histidine kinase
VVVAIDERVAGRSGAGDGHSRPDLVIPGDGDQLDQVLINSQNALEAVQGRGAVVGAGSIRAGRGVRDDGRASTSANLFVPFFTTKPGGTGSSALSRRSRRRMAGRWCLPIG